MKKTSFMIPNGVWPTMITPFLADGSRIDFQAVDALVDWYIQKGAAGIFAVCQSSEMFFLSLEERVSLAEAVVRQANGRIPVIASGHTAISLDGQIEELKAMATTGVKAVVLLPNRLASQTEDDDVLIRNLNAILEALDEETELGLYECPYPYKRLVSPSILRFCLSTGRFSFLKDTSCNMDNISEKLDVLKGSNFKLFNANSAFLLESLRAGAAGFSGVMANIHPQLYVTLCKSVKAKGNDSKTELLSSFLGAVSAVESRQYPTCAKYFHQKFGVPMNLYTRSTKAAQLQDSFRKEIEQLEEITINFAKLTC